ncbi:hypothetical protein PGN80_13165 [Klebsiella aerogenes]|uniref:hypothetical protein n=1 Tax=Klebsiella aerogenes TaxID=548 RepID=UPI00301CA6F1
MKEQVKLIRQCEQVAQVEVVNGVKNPHVQYFEVMLKQGCLFASGMYKGQTVTIFDTLNDWKEVRIMQREEFKSSESGKAILIAVLSVVAIVAFIVINSI